MNNSEEVCGECLEKFRKEEEGDSDDARTMTNMDKQEHLTIEEIKKRAQDIMWREDNIGGKVLNENAVLEFLDWAYAAAKQEGYREGHIDHQLTLEASAEVFAEHMKKTADEKAGMPMSYTFSGKEILAKAREEGIREAREAVDAHFKKSNYMDNVNDALASIDSLIEKL